MFVALMIVIMLRFSHHDLREAPFFYCLLPCFQAAFWIRAHLWLLLANLSMSTGQ